MSNIDPTAIEELLNLIATSIKMHRLGGDPVPTMQLITLWMEKNAASYLN